MSGRTYEIILWGATGFTGKLVAEHLATAPSAAGLRWAIAGRNRVKLEALKGQLGVDELGIIVAESLGALAAQGAVVCTTVGPYMQYGAGLVDACVAERTHYCDLTGEVPFIREMIDAHHERAKADGTRIVHCCGFDSIPSDLGVLMMHEAMTARGAALSKVDSFFGEAKGGFSGGTIASLLGILEAVKKDRSILKIIGDPYGLDPRPRRGGADSSDRNNIAYEKRIGCWTAPFLMAPINTRIVRRTNAICEYRYGGDFRYTERMSTGNGAKGFAMATTIVAGLGSFVVASQSSVLRKLIAKMLPSSGEGPSEQQRDEGRFVVKLIAEGITETSDDPLVLRGRVADNRDPGYGSTKVMLGEAALSLARDSLTTAGGVTTPAAALGTALLDRLRGAGMTWTVA